MGGDFMFKNERILIVDDDKILVEHLKAGLAQEDYEIIAVSKGSIAIELAKKRF
jgi:DNA-binding response OmpR family regulator